MAVSELEGTDVNKRIKGGERHLSGLTAPRGALNTTCSGFTAAPTPPGGISMPQSSEPVNVTYLDKVLLKM